MGEKPTVLIASSVKPDSRDEVWVPVVGDRASRGKRRGRGVGKVSEKVLHREIFVEIFVRYWG